MNILLSNYEKLKRKGIIIEKGQKFGFIVVEIPENVIKELDENEIKNYGIEVLLSEKHKFPQEDFII
ncbi:MAG: hypothetical protein QW076_02620 [Candidatus Anstonellales archaeon]